MFVSLSLPVGTADDHHLLGQRAAQAEALGFDAVNVTDHPAPPSTWLESGGHATLDAFVALSFAAAATTTLRVHTNLLVLGYRHALTTAKAVASLDALSGGRVILGVGVGYLQAEFDALAAPFDNRGRLASDALATMQAAWTGQPFGPNGTVVAPQTPQQPHPPIWVGGNSLAAMRRAVQFGQGWSPMPSPKTASEALGTPGIESVAALGKRIDRLGELAAEAGRSEPLDIAVIPLSLSGFATATPSADEALDEIKQLQSAGGTALVVSLPEQGWDDRVAWLAQEVLAHL